MNYNVIVHRACKNKPAMRKYIVAAKPKLKIVCKMGTVSVKIKLYF